MKIPSILVIDDELDNFDVIETLLPERGYQLHYASNGQDALAFLEAFTPDLILLDVMMPDMNGIEVCQRIKAMPKLQPVPIIMVTALVGKEDLAHCFKAGADDFISKPVNGLELRARVHSMLRIKHQYDDLQTLLQLREDMVNIIVHDLRNPLSNILFGLDLMEVIDLTKEEQKQKISQMRFSGQQLRSLVDDLLIMAKVESGKLCLNLIEIDLGSLIHSALSNFEVIAAMKNLSLSSQLPSAWGGLYVDAPIFRRVIDNLLSNAIKFSPRGSQVTISGEYLESGGARIQVADLGPGVADEMQQKIFEKFEIGTLMEDVSQIGLGLTFCKMVVEAHNGTICVKHNQPKGAIFEITLPDLRDAQPQPHVLEYAV